MTMQGMQDYSVLAIRTPYVSPEVIYSLTASVSGDTLIGLHMLPGCDCEYSAGQTKVRDLGQVMSNNINILTRPPYISLVIIGRTHGVLTEQKRDHLSLVQPSINTCRLVNFNFKSSVQDEKFVQSASTLGSLTSSYTSLCIPSGYY